MKPPSDPLDKNQLFSGHTEDNRFVYVLWIEKALRENTRFRFLAEYHVYVRRQRQRYLSEITYPTRHIRQFEENLPRGAVPGRIWGNMCFAHILQKELQTSAEKGSLNRPLPFLIFFNSGLLLDP